MFFIPRRKSLVDGKMNKVHSFSLTDEAVKIIEQTPIGERSRFVADAILQLDRHYRETVVHNIKSFSLPHSNNEKSTVALLREIRDKAK